jgi:hypothetical protein
MRRFDNRNAATILGGTPRRRDTGRSCTIDHDIFLDCVDFCDNIALKQKHDRNPDESKSTQPYFRTRVQADRFPWF